MTSASGANADPNEIDPVKTFEARLLKAGLITEKDSEKIWADFEAEGVRATEIARAEPQPTADSIWNNTFVGSENADWRNF